MPTTSEHRISVLLTLLGPQVARDVLDELPPAKQAKLRSRVDALTQNPPSPREVNEVLREFDRMLKIAVSTPAADSSDSPKPRVKEEKPVAKFQIYPPPVLSEDPFEAINQISQVRLVAALADETPRTVALIVNCMHEERAARLLQQFAAEKRDAVILQLKERINTPLALLRRLVQAILEKCDEFVEEDLLAAQEDSDKRVAKLLRTMTPEARGELLAMLEASDPDACERIRASLFTIEDLVRVKDKTLQSILGEIDARTLAIVLKISAEELSRRILGNLSKRARASLEEEMQFLGDLPAAEKENAIQAVLKAMIELDKNGELKMLDD